MNQTNQFGRIFLAGLLLVLLISVLTNRPADAVRMAPAPPTSVAMVNLEKTFNGLEEWVGVESTLSGMAVKIEDEAASRKELVEGLYADVEDYPVGSEKYKEALRKYEIAALEFQAYVAMHQGRRMEFNDTEIKRIYQKIKASAKAMADEQGLDLILVDDSVVAIPENTKDILAQISSRRVLFSREQLDITEALITKMNSQYQSGGS